MADNFERVSVDRNRVNSGNSDRREQVGGPLSEADPVPSLFGQREPLRQPRTSPPVSEDRWKAAGEGRSVSHDAHNSRIATGLAAEGVLQSNLSVDAVEFYPAGYSQQEPVYEDTQDQYYPETLAELVHEFLSHLNSSPGAFESDIVQITSTLNEFVTREETLQELVELIYTQSTTIPYFSYTGARLCNHLAHHLSFSPAGRNFRQLLLQRCHMEFEQRDQAVRGDEATQKSFHSYVLFLGELYLNLEVNTRGIPARADILLDALRKLLDSLFSNPQDKNLICAVKLLKLTGSVLEGAWKEKGMTDMDELVQKIQSVLLDATCGRDVKQMLLKLVELRSSDWGRVQGATAACDATPDNDPNYFMNEPTFYTRDGTPFTAADPEYAEKYQEILDQEDYFPDLFEENGNDPYYDSGDEMDPEIEEAYEKFCLESEQKRKP
ncbi:polyadenylate-binding protein-interacting protein 1 [Conger conger]|uniref:polyadenylate-binding protein-interacting protein 1 n=1 Tax=Conger conger TaxID=82655 RepID=UPI002A5A4718|nr:polyadenylate-binding protein-interacting protein 1 [Conger conger]